MHIFTKFLFNVREDYSLNVYSVRAVYKQFIIVNVLDVN